MTPRAREVRALNATYGVDPAAAFETTMTALRGALAPAGTGIETPRVGHTA